MLNCPNIQILYAVEANKRVQLCTGFRECKSDFIVICDDDTTWTQHVLKGLIDPLRSNQSLGAVFPEVKFRPKNDQSFVFWEQMAAIRLSGDAIDIRTTMLMDGGVLCASGTTAAYRGCILQDEKFMNVFENEYFMGTRINAGDDQTVTRWLCNNGWDVTVVPDEGPSGLQVLTAPRATWRHLLQLVRWSRSDWQSYIKALLVDRIIWQ
jgi:cellulose synthase/poly-beta-1,6-N-acetylglucosamine synthase-like glycosyltransferase